MPEELLEKIIKVYLSEGKFQLIETLILGLELDKTKQIYDCDLNSIMKICLDNHFYNPLIYLCTASDSNFMIPLIQIFSQYLDKKSKEHLDKKEIKKIGYR